MPCCNVGEISDMDGVCSPFLGMSVHKTYTLTQCKCLILIKTVLKKETIEKELEEAPDGALSLLLSRAVF